MHTEKHDSAENHDPLCSCGVVQHTCGTHGAILLCEPATHGVAVNCLQTKTRNGNFTKECWIFTTRWKLVSVCHTLALQKPQLRRRNDAFLRSVNTAKMHEYAENVKDHLSVSVENLKVFAQNMGVVLSVNTASSDRIAGVVEDQLFVCHGVENVKIFAQNMGVVLSVSTVRSDNVVSNVKEEASVDAGNVKIFAQNMGVVVSVPNVECSRPIQNTTNTVSTAS